MTLIENTDENTECSDDRRVILQPRLLTISEAARLLRIGRTTAYELIGAGELKVIHIGRSARVATAEIDEFVERHRAQGRSSAR